MPANQCDLILKDFYQDTDKFEQKKKLPPFSILYLSSYPPRECGIATYTRDLVKAIDKRFAPCLDSKILAINENGSSVYNYGSKVKYQINQTEIEDYINVAKKVNKDDSIKLINIQHEFGLFGGEWGDYLLAFLEIVKKPVVVTFHSLIPNPEPRLKKVVRAIASRCEKIITMAETGINTYENDYGLKRSKLVVIPHGTPTIDSANHLFFKNKFGFEGKILLSTFGLLSRGKGIEYAIKALPPIVKEHPEIIYLIIGETHPVVRKHEGEKYRNKLIKLALELHLENNVKFYNKYLSLEEIIDYLKATDIYLCTPVEPNQVTSGTLAYALSAGKAIVASSFLHAREVLSDGRGMLVGLKDAPGITRALGELINQPAKKRELEQKAYQYGQTTNWPSVAEKHLVAFKKIINLKNKAKPFHLPALNLNHLYNLSDDVGIIQHAKHSINDRSSGYTTDDNARALIVATMHYKKFKDAESLKFIKIYLSFLYHALTKDNWFHNFMNYDRRFLDKRGSEDCFGRALWAMGVVVSSNLHENIKKTAKFIFDKSVRNLRQLKSPRGQAFSLIGLYHYYQICPEVAIKEQIIFLAEKLVKLYRTEKTKDWHWFEEDITYDNGRLPEALFLAYEIIKDKNYLKIAKEALDFLSSLVIINNKLVLIGQHGWYKHKGKRAFYDQQPVDAASMTQVFLSAYATTKEKKYYEKAIVAFSWFLGENSINQPVYDEITGGCYDGLLPECVNLNQGAESTISYLLARLSLE
ncbi:MAG TPA: glycosyltransferase [bacterium]|nr:glycosyltransferase [bacterium]HPL95403.1 glycosyltransferase [bacterium]